MKSILSGQRVRLVSRRRQALVEEAEEAGREGWGNFRGGGAEGERDEQCLR